MQSSPELGIVSKDFGGPNYAETGPGGGSSKWVYFSTSYGSNAERLTHQSLMLAFVAGALKIPGWYALAIGTANTLYSFDVTQVWYKRLNYKEQGSNYTTCRRANKTYFYRYSNYTGLLSSTPLQAEAIDPCASGY